MQTLSTGPTLFTQEFALTGRVGLITGGNRGIGLEAAMALCEAGARTVYCVDLPKQPGEQWLKVKEHLGKMGGNVGQLEYMSEDVRDQVRGLDYCDD